VSSSTVRIATPADRARVVDTVVAAFDADPAFGFFFPDRATFAEHAATYAGYLFDKRVVQGTVWVVEEGGAAALWDPPSAGDIVGPDAATLDLPAHLMARLDDYHDVVHDVLPTTAHWYLGVLATHPTYAGRRLGRTVMAAGLARAAADALPAYLETTNPRNVELYLGAGWEVTASVGVPDLDVWVMRHPGQPT
jgi:GNAT superfamily N-acetyltransferase